MCLAAIQAGADLNFYGDVLDIDDLDEEEAPATPLTVGAEPPLRLD